MHWNDGIQRIALDGALRVGATFEMTPPGEQPITSTIIELDPPRLLTDNTDLEGLSIRVEHRLDPSPEGATTISYTVTVTGDAPDEVVAAVSADFPDVLANLATAAEK